MSVEQTTRNIEFVPSPSDRTKRRTKTGRPYSEELRSRVVAAIEAGASVRQAAARHGVSASVAAKPMGGDRRSRLKDERDWLLRRIVADPELTPADLHKELCARGIQVGYRTVRSFVRKQKMDLK